MFARIARLFGVSRNPPVRTVTYPPPFPDKRADRQDDGEFPAMSDFEFVRELGRGGMGVVYQCRHLSTGRIVAVKLMRNGPQSGLEALARFRIEAEALACLNHPNVARIFKVGVHNEHPYYVTEFAPNGTIGDYVTAAGKSVDWTVDAIRQVALGLQHAHERSMIHRDIKPANILIVEDESPKVTDFGLVKFRVRVGQIADASRAPHIAGSFCDFDQLLENYDDMEIVRPSERLIQAMIKACQERNRLPPDSIDAETVIEFLNTMTSVGDNGSSPAKPSAEPVLDDLTAPGSILGSPSYMAPEQIAGDAGQIGPATDVYGLGATLYRLLTGRPVADGACLSEIFHMIRTEFPPPVRELNPNVPDGVECVIWKAIQKDIPRRYQTCAEFAEELATCLNGRPPQTQLRRDRRMANRPSQNSPDTKYEDAFLKAFPKKES